MKTKGRYIEILLPD